MKIDETPIMSVVTEIIPGPPTSGWPGMKATLACGHPRRLEAIEGKTIEIESGWHQDGVWHDWKGREIGLGDAIECVTCTEATIRERLAAHPAEKAERFETQEALLAAHPSAKWHNYGPVHKHGDKFYVIGYLGQHEWIAVNVDDTREVRMDPGWEGTVYGWAYIPEEVVGYAMRYGPIGPNLEPPERSGKPVTLDMRLFADRDKLKGYLGPDDPLCPK